MEINIEETKTKEMFSKLFKDGKGISNLVFVSTDNQDKGKLFNVEIEKISSIEEGINDDNEDSLVVWWKWWNTIEGKYVIMSNHFSQYLFY